MREAGAQVQEDHVCGGSVAPRPYRLVPIAIGTVEVESARLARHLGTLEFEGEGDA